MLSNLSAEPWKPRAPHHMLTSSLLLLLLLLLYQHISAKRVRLHQTQQYDLKKQIKTCSKDPVEDIVVLPAGTILVIRQKLALKRYY